MKPKQKNNVSKAICSLMLCGLVSCTNSPAKEDGIRVQTAKTRVTPENPNLKPTLAKINWQKDRWNEAGIKMLKAGYVAIAQNNNKTVQMFAGKTYGRASIVRIYYNPDELVGKMHVSFVGLKDPWMSYVKLRQELTKAYGSGVSVGEPRYRPNASTISQLYKEKKAPGTYWHFKKTGYTVALLVEKPTSDPDEPVGVSVHLEPPDWDPKAVNDRLGLPPSKKK